MTKAENFVFFDSLFILLRCQKDPEVHSRFSERMLGFVLMSTGGEGVGRQRERGKKRERSSLSR